MLHQIKIAMKLLLVTAVFLLSVGKAVAGDDNHSSHGMTMHHMHIMLNHAVETAAKGSNLIMIGQMGMAPGVDELSIEEGKAMIASAKATIVKVMKGDTMKNMHMDGVTGTNDMMAHTHGMGDAAMKYVELLEGMNGSMKHH